MNWKLFAPTLFAGLVLPSLAASQDDRYVPPPSAGQMYEDIEIMRRLLSSKLQALVPQSNVHVLASPYAQNALLFGTPTDGTVNPLDPLTLPDQNVLNPYATLTQVNPEIYGSGTKQIWSRLLNRNGMVLRSHHRPLIALSATPKLLAEGTWLKGQGIVFTLTLPPPARDPRPEQPQPAPKPPSDWDRIRKEVRQEKPQSEETAKPAKEPTLSDVILRVLADNGKHFTQLGANESLTVAITFRKPEPSVGNGTGVAFADLDNDGYPDLFLGARFDDVSLAAGLDPTSAQTRQPPKEEKPAAEDANQKKVKDLILLGELHLKQSKTDEAIKVLRQALELKPEGEQAAAANKNLAQALIAAQKYDEAGQALQKAAEWLKKRQVETAPKKESSGASQPAPLPSKLVIAVSKKLVDDVGSGKITLEEFKKAASVEYLTFAPEKK